MTASELKMRLAGVTAERGCLIRCRDAPALQVVTHIDKTETIRVIFAQDSCEERHDNGGILFARARPEFQAEIQHWLDPSRRREARGGTAAPQNEDSGIDSDDEDDEDDS